MGKALRFFGIEMINNVLIKTHPNIEFIEMEKFKLFYL